MQNLQIEKTSISNAPAQLNTLFREATPKRTRLFTT